MPPSRQCFYSAGARSFTRVHSNLTVLAEHESPIGLANLLDGHVCPEVLPELIHELTHHWMLKAPLGVALAALGMHAARAAWVMNERKTDAAAGAFADIYLRFTCALRTLRPFAEGVAVFAELDCYPEKLENLSEILQLVTTLGALYPPEFAVDVLAEKLRYGRLQQLEKRAGLFSSPMKASDGGYLIGYVYFRNLWLEASMRDPSLRSADRFLDYMLNVICKDFSLIEIILTDQKGAGVFAPHLLARAIVQCIVDRVRAALSTETRHHYTERRQYYRECMQSHLEPSRGGGDESFSREGFEENPFRLNSKWVMDSEGLLYGESPEAQFRGAILLDAWIDNLFSTYDGQNAANFMLFQHRKLASMFRRAVFNIKSIDVVWVIDGEQVVFRHAQRPVATMPTSVAPDLPSAGRGTLEVAASCRGQVVGTFTVLVTGDSKYLLRGLETVDAETKTMFLSWIARHQDEEAFDQMFDEFLEESIGQVLKDASVQKFYADCDRVVDSALSSACTSAFPENHRQLLSAAMRNAGYFGILESPHWVRLSALASYATSACLAREEFDELLVNFGASPEEFDEYCVACSTKLGVNALEEIGGTLVSRI